MAQQKLYTEEQVREMLLMTDMVVNGDLVTHDDIISTTTPIELPSDEEMGVIALNVIENLKDKLTVEQEAFFIAGFMESNKWMRDKILNK